MAEGTFASGAPLNALLSKPPLDAPSPVAAGAAAGTVYSIVRNEPALGLAARTAASFAIVASTFCVFREVVATLRGGDSGAVTSGLAGGVAGGVLRSVHAGRRLAPSGVVAGALLAGGTHAAALVFRSDWWAAVEAPDWVWAFSPIKKLTDEEAAAHIRYRAARVSAVVDDPPAGARARDAHAAQPDPS